jgi:hypothetical protein
MIRSKLCGVLVFVVDLWANGSGYFWDVRQLGRWFWNGMGSTFQPLVCAGKLLAVHCTLDLNLRRLRSLDEDKISGVGFSFFSHGIFSWST